MPPSKPGASLDALRAAAAEAEQASSLRAVAREIGMSPTGLRNFLDGQTPYPSTRRKLNLWYARYRLSRRVFAEDEVSAGLALLLEAIPETGYARAAERVLACVAEVHADTHVEAPAWLTRLREAVSRREGGRDAASPPDEPAS